MDIKHIHNVTWQVNELYILKKHDSVYDFNKVLTINRFLKNEKIPVADYIRTSSGGDYVSRGEAAYSLSRKLRGGHIVSFMGESQELAYDFGVQTAKLHIALAKLENHIGEYLYDGDLARDLAKACVEIRSNGIEVPERILRSCLEFEDHYRSLPKQLIHRDVWGGNILFMNGRLSAFLDFDSGERNARLYDLVYFGQSILVNNYKDDKFIVWWKGFFAALLRGYGSESRISRNELDAIHMLCVSMQLGFISYYLWVKEKSHLIPNRAGMAVWAFNNAEVFRFSLDG